MNLRDFKIGWRMLVQEPAYSAGAIFGLALGISVCFLLTALVNYALNFNSPVPDSERIYLVKHRNVLYGMGNAWGVHSPLAIRDLINSSGMDIKTSGALELSLNLRSDLTRQKEKLLLVDSTFPEIFGIKAIKGDLRSALSEPNSLAITTAIAERYFGTTEAIGRILTIENQSFMVAAILKEAPDNTTVNYQILANFRSPVWTDKNRQEFLSNWSYTIGENFLKLGPSVTAEAVTRLMQESADRAPSSELSSQQQIQFGVKHAIQLELSRLSEIYFDSDINGESSLANRPAVFGLLALALLILFLAANNYVNLASIRTLRRQREISIRKVLGASPSQIICQFVCESMLVTLTAVALGILIAWLILPTFSTLIGLELSNIISFQVYIACAVLAVALGLLTCVYPVYLALRIRPGSALAGRAETEHHTGLWLRRVLTTLQFSSALGLTSVCFCIAWQTLYVSTSNPGFDTKNLWIIDTPQETTDVVKQNLIEQLAHIPEVLEVSSAIEGFDTWSSHSRDFNAIGKESANLDYASVTPNFFGVYGVHAAAGRLFDAKLDQTENKSFVVINAAASRSLGFSTPKVAIGSFLKFGDDSRQIIRNRTRPTLQNLEAQTRSHGLFHRKKQPGFRGSTTR